MTVLIYFICLLCAAIIQTFLRILLNNGAVQFIPGTFIFYLVAIWVARKWSNSYKEKKEMEKIQEEITRDLNSDSHKE